MKQLDERLRSQFSQLSPQEQRIAEFVFDHYDDLLGYNSAELARLSGVSKATVSRLFKRLGYGTYKEMRNELRTLRQSGMPLADVRDAVQGNTLLARHYKQEMASLTQWVNALDSNQFSEIVDALSAGKRIFIIGLRNSYPVALHLRQQLQQVREGTVLLPQPGQTFSEELIDITPEDMAVVVAFRRRPRILQPLLQQLAQRDIPVLVICEPQAQSAAALARWQLCVPLDSVSAFDCYSAANSLVNLLSNALLHAVLRTGRQRIHQIAHLYDALDELESR